MLAATVIQLQCRGDAENCFIRFAGVMHLFIAEQYHDFVGLQFVIVYHGATNRRLRDGECHETCRDRTDQGDGRVELKTAALEFRAVKQLVLPNARLMLGGDQAHFPFAYCPIQLAWHGSGQMKDFIGRCDTHGIENSAVK
ncbi:hypothetical protein D3C78_1316870 [compost metagenome]